LPLKGFRKSKRFTRRVNLIFSSEHGAPRKVKDFSGQKARMACEND